ncbi:MAG: hypothetical protein HOV67_11770, partial [Kribbellaceae bacterium]|nr:hypothetical protein [Kribbellaceae bacterium]
MVRTGVRVQAAGIAAAAGALTVLIGAGVLLVQSGAGAGPAAAPVAAMAAPPGNNGTIKIDGVDVDSGPPDNNP